MHSTKTKTKTKIESAITQVTNRYKDTVFNEKQLDFINDHLCDAKLLGIPGGGKTRSIIEKIRRCFDHGVFKKNSDCVIVTFSRMASNEFIVKGKQVVNKFSKGNVKTLHSLAGTIVKNVLQRESSSQNTVIVSALKILENDANFEKVRGTTCLKSIKAIFVDEAQDISGSQYNFLMKLKQCLNCFMILVGDPNQNIYQFQGGSDKYLLEYPGKTYHLTNNYRSTSNIVNFVNCIAPNKTDMVSMAGSAHDNDNAVVKVVISDVHGISNDILKEILGSGYPLRDIAIIGPVKMCKPKDNGRQYTNVGLSLATNILWQNNVKFVKHYHDSGDNDVNTAATERQDEHVNILTIHGSKGLEFKKVILLNFHYETFGYSSLTHEAFNHYKYLWYVGCSRAKNEMTIYVDSDPKKHAWPLLEDVDKSTYQLIELTQKRDIFLEKPLQFQDETHTLSHTVTKFIQSLTPEDYYDFESLVQYKVTDVDLFDISDVDIHEYSKFACLYGLFIEKVCSYQYHMQNGEGYNIFECVLYKLRNTINCPQNHQIANFSLAKKLSYDLETQLTLNFFERHKDHFNERESSFYSWLKNKMAHDYEKGFFIAKSSLLFAASEEEVVSICQHMLKNVSDPNYITNVFRVVLHAYQIKYEAGYLWHFDFTEHIQSLEDVINNIDRFVKSQSNLTFWQQNEHPNFPIRGETDILKNDNEIIDIKFTKQFTNQQVFQLLLYYNNVCPAWDKDIRLKVWNFLLGKEYEITISNDLCNYNLLRFLCDKTKLKMKNLLFLYDLETTGLDTNTCEVIDRYFEEYNLKFVVSNGLLRTNSELPQDITNITNITDEMLKTGDSFEQFRQEISSVYRYCEKPAFMAHNGKCFDHQVLRSQGILKNTSIFLDSKQIIRMISATDTHRLNLTQTYKIVMGVDVPYVAHRAKEDVEMMKDMLKVLEYQYPMYQFFF